MSTLEVNPRTKESPMRAIADHKPGAGVAVETEQSRNRAYGERVIAEVVTVADDLFASYPETNVELAAAIVVGKYRLDPEKDIQRLHEAAAEDIAKRNRGAGI